MKKERKICNCGSKEVIKKGRPKNKFGVKQMYYCKCCNKMFSDKKLDNKMYGSKVIVNSLSYYNLGNTLNESVKLVNKQFKVKISKSSVFGWLKEFKDLCGYWKLRDGVIGEYGKDILVNKTFEHNGLAYNFRYHKGKLGLCGLDKLVGYVKGFENGCPKFFDDIDNRCSKMKIDIDVDKDSVGSDVCKMAELAIGVCDNNRERHSAVENFMLVNDEHSVVCELPVWLWEKNFDFGISGHIDLLQVRDGMVYVMDYKPGARKENSKKVGSQLYFYASGLSFRTGLGLEKFKCVWFDDKDYFEFSPKEVRVRFPGSKWRSGNERM